jgi:hypothetical protein
MTFNGAEKMEESKSRKFVVASVITDGTTVFGTTHGKYKQILEKEFQESFRKIREARDKRKTEGCKEE